MPQTASSCRCPGESRRPPDLREPAALPPWVVGFRPTPVGLPVCRLPVLGYARPELCCQDIKLQAPVPLLRCGGGPTGLEGLLEGLTAQLMPLITELVRKAVESALAGQLPTTSQHGSPGSREQETGEPRAKKHKGAGKEHKRKQPEISSAESGRGRGSPSESAPPRKGKGAGGNSAAPPETQPTSAWVNEEADTWQQVGRRETEPFELRAQDWDAPIVPTRGLERNWTSWQLMPPWRPL